jgi:hypothetical protein
LAGIFGLAGCNDARLAEGRATLGPPMGSAVAAGLFVALDTTDDARGLRASADPFPSLACFFLLTAFDRPLVVALGPRRGRLAGMALRPRLRRGRMGALVAFRSFGGLMLATRLGPLGQAAVRRKTLTVFAALIGWPMPGAKTGPRRLALMWLIATGEVVVQVAGCGRKSDANGLAKVRDWVPLSRTPPRWPPRSPRPAGRPRAWSGTGAGRSR